MATTITLPEIIEKHNLNKAHLARLMQMPVGTFKNKVLKNVQPYHLTSEESKRLLGILNQMKIDIENVKL